MTLPVVGYAGMTHLGLVSAAAGAERGARMVCFDRDAALVGRLQRGELPVVEPDLPEVLGKNRGRIRFTSRAEDLAECEVVYIAPDVPTDESGSSDLQPVDALIAIVAPQLQKDAVLVVLSQVPPGFTRERQRPALQLYYQVETLIFGRAVERALGPERFIVGCPDPAAPLPPAFRRFLEAFGCPILPMRFESAELTKIAINCFLVASVSTANTLAELCEGIGADWSEIAPALRLDKRIGQHAYLSAGLGIAGGNLERDLATVCRLADKVGSDAGVVKAWIANSKHRKTWAAQTIRKVLLKDKPGALVAVWGLAYKENTHSIKNSPSLATLAELPDTRLKLHDPVVSPSLVKHSTAEPARTPLVAAKDADALMILTPWPEYRRIAPRDIAAAMSGKIVVDPYRVLDPREAAAAGLQILTLGRAAGSTHA
jgi:UDPglucose 6-dehydrogenase